MNPLQKQQQRQRQRQQQLTTTHTTHNNTHPDRPTDRPTNQPTDRPTDQPTAHRQDRTRGHTAKQTRVDDEKTADREQWTQGLFSYCKGRFTDRDCNESERQEWLASISKWAEADPLQEEPHIQVSEVFRSAGGDAGSSMDGYVVMLDQVCQPDTWRLVLTVAHPKQAGADEFQDHRYLSLLATMGKWMMRVLVERMIQHPRPDVPRRVHTFGFTQGWQTSAVIGTIRDTFWCARRFRRK